MVDDERGAVIREDVLEEPVKKDRAIQFLQCLSVIPGGRADEPVIGPFIPPVEEVVFEPVLETTKRFNARHDLPQGDPFAEVSKQAVTEGFKADRCKHDLRVLPLRNRQDFGEDGGMGIDVIDPADQIDL